MVERSVMSGITNRQSIDPLQSLPEESRKKHSRQLLLFVGGGLLWSFAVMLMIMLALFVHAHRQPYPFEVITSRDIQRTITAPWIGATFRFLTMINDPIPDVVTVILTLVVFVLFHWFRPAIFLALSTCIGNGVDALIGDLVQRPRPAPNLIHVDSRLIFNSFPSGHSCHMMVFYGFLLFLSFTRPVRAWRYHWLVILFQIWAMANILLVGFARLWEGEHWLLDVIGGYLDGAIWMSLFIVLFLWARKRFFEKKREQAA